ncbi:MAG TPA: hypothetical protein VFA61_10200 [Candidatus Udaeobacter sp.]|nr:hypothetical protein [Candidatus Udaeobacter sp.]
MTEERSHCPGALDSFVLLALVITFLLRYSSFLTSGLLFGPFLDNVHIYGPIFSEVSRLALSGSVPYYLPDIGTGFPIFESPHFSILYPFYFFGLLSYGGPLASLYTLTHLTLLHLFVFYVNLYVLLRCATVPPWAAYVAASVGMLAWNTQLYASWITVTASYAWLPLVLAGGVLLLRFPGKPSGILVFSVAAGLLALASPSQAVIHAGLSCLLLFATGIAWLCLQKRFVDIWHLACSLLLCGGIIFGLAGAALLPTYIATDEMIRHVGAGATVIGHAHIPWKSFNLYQLSLNQAAGVVIRPGWIAIVGSPYVGPLGVVGVLLAGIYFRQLNSFTRMLVMAFGVIGLYGLLSGFGTNLGLAYINFRLPLIDKIREAGRHLILFVIGVSFLSGLGYSLFEQSFQRYKQSDRIRPLILPAILGVIFAGIILWELLPTSHGGLPRSLWIMAVAPILLAVGRLFRLSHYNNVVPAAAIVSVAAAVIPIRGLSVSQSDFDKPINLLSHRVLKRMAPEIDAANYRVDFRDEAFSNRFWAMNASYYGIRSFYNQLTPQPYDQFRFSNLTNVPHLREMMGARYVLCGPADSPTDPGAKQILETEGYRLYENSSAMGRLTLVHRLAGFAKNENEFISIIKKGFDYFSAAYATAAEFEMAQGFLRRQPRSENRGDRIVKVVDKPNRSYVTVISASSSLLILNEWFTPSWKARVNGKKRPVLRVNQWQAGVLLNAGENRVEFEYRPTLFWVLMILNRITLALLLVFTIFAVVTKAVRHIQSRQV